MLDVKNLSKTFLKGTPNEHTALQNLSLHLEKGDFVTVIGSNGAGKSTLFNAIAGSFLCEERRLSAASWRLLQWKVLPPSLATSSEI